jgi:hypothetical protein
MTDMKSEMSDMKSEITDMKTDISIIKTTQNCHTLQLDKIDSKIPNITRQQASSTLRLHDRVTALEQRAGVI